MKLRNLDVSNAKARAVAYKLTDGNGLYLDVRPSGAKVWRYRYRIAGKENIYTIGNFGDTPGTFTLAEARRERALAAEQVERGSHPRALRIAGITETINESKNTFASAAREWLEAKRPPTVTAEYHERITKALERCVIPYIGERNMREIATPEIFDLLKRLSKTPRWAEDVKGACSQVFDYAAMRGLVNHNPVLPLKRLIGEAAIIKKRPVKHNPWLHLADVPAFLKAVEKRGDDVDERGIARNERALGLKLLMLTMVRPNELAQAPWAEFDFDKALWTVPAGRMKMRVDHFVPLSRQALELLRELKALTGDTPYVLPERCAKRRKGIVPKNPSTFRRFIHDLPEWNGRITAHGCRGTAATALNQATRADGTRRFDRDWIECQLAHTLSGHYNHADYLPQRAEMLQAWADMVMPRSKVIALPKRKAA